MTHFGTIRVGADGPRDAIIALIAQSPGAEEERQGHPLVGPAGLLLQECVRAAKLNWAALYRTNVFKYRLLTKDRGAIEDLVDDARQDVVKELTALTRLQVLVTLGNEAMCAVLGIWGITEHHGKSSPLPWHPNNPTVYVSFHPSWVLRNGATDEDKKLVTDVLQSARETALRLRGVVAR